MTPTELYNELLKRTEAHVQNFKCDFDHDKRTLEKYPSQPFIHMARTHGTAMVVLHKADIFPAKNEVVPYLFSRANREEILKGLTDTVEYYMKQDASHINYYDGKTLKKIDAADTALILKNYVRKTKEAWTAAETELINS
jgi:hypothetical protein